MNLLPLVLAAHFLGDWVAQTDWQAATKVRPPRVMVRGRLVYERSYRESWAAMGAHMASYHAVLWVALRAAYWHDIRTWVPDLIVLGSLVTHAFIDRRWPVRWLMRHTGSGAFAETSWGVLAVDQALHLSVLCLLVAAVS